MDKSSLPDRMAELEDQILSLRNENDRLNGFVEIGKILNVERSVQRLIPPVMAEIRKCLDADRSTLFLIDLDRSEVSARYGEGLNDQMIRIQLKMGIVGLCVLTRKEVNIEDAYSDPRFDRGADRETAPHLICCPAR